MKCPVCTSKATSERPERTELGYRRFCCRNCGGGFNERSGTVIRGSLQESMDASRCKTNDGAGCGCVNLSGLFLEHCRSWP
jgi:transposase-like protein